MTIKRLGLELIKKKLEPGKVVLLYGPRRVGKTFLLTQLQEQLKNQEKIAYFAGDRAIVQKTLSSLNPEAMRQFIGQETTLLIIDEAQKIPQIGDNLKLLVDSYPKLKIIASGSASLSLAQKVGEPLTGRKKTLLLYPISAKEIIQTKNQGFYLETLEERLIFGSYPEIFQKGSWTEKQEYLLELVDSYLFKDILELEQLKHSKKLVDLLTLIAFQIGQEVSLSELGNRLDFHKDTVARYLDLLEKAFILVNIRGFSRNLRKEISKTSRYYFWDNGIRNAVINQFNPLNQRNDLGQLWENYLIIERLKKQSYEQIFSRNFFWRTYSQAEIDWVEEREGKLFGFEIKWSPRKKIKPPKDWLKTYDNASWQLITQENFLEFIA